MTQTQKGDEQPNAQHYLNLIFEKFEEQEQRLTKTGEDAAEAIDDLLDLIRTLDDKIFWMERSLYAGLDGFKKVMGHTNHLVMYIELLRKKLSQPEILAQSAMKQVEMQGQQQTLPVAARMAQDESQGGYGFWHYMGERKRSGALEHIFGQSKQPQMTASERQLDFMNYARDIPAELNKLYDWLGGTLLRLKRFKNETTQRVCYSMLRTHIEKLAAQVTGFSNATIELRKELVGEREVAYAQAMTMLEQARLTAQSQPVRGAPLSIDPNALRIRDSVR